ncbi:3-phosphoinositide-dependent protein kinase 1-like [Halichondria panicea]|uniref:3-phosphoinositide-dependent protein kinase 1-like n=1 Tax=Halichondria panicea TaxID=6063 RepID=UPI00312B2D6C
MAANPAEKEVIPEDSDSKAQPKRSRDEFVFDKILGEGSYSTVVLATDKVTKKQYAMKILDKRHIIREKKVPYVSREKDVLTRLDHPFFVKLYFTFQDKDNLYFGLSLAKRGELLEYLKKVGAFDENAAQFYTAEIVLALEYLHSKGIIHRDLKPENILLDENMHIQITDFGTAKIIEGGNDRANSFVGTAEYVSPELLQNKVAFKSSDLWALGCILCQLLSGRPPFHAPNEYLCFQKITKLEYMIPEGFPDNARDLVSKLLLLDPAARLGCDQMGGYPPLKDHLFFEDIDWETIHEQTPPKLMPYLPSNTKGESALRSDILIGDGSSEEGSELSDWELFPSSTKSTNQTAAGSEGQEREEQLKQQAKDSPWNQFVNGELIVMTGLIDKRKGLFSKRRQFILTDKPRLYYVDPVNMDLKGEVPLSDSMTIEVKNWKIFFVHTPSRTYYLEDPTGQSQKWADTLNEWMAKRKARNTDKQS